MTTYVLVPDGRPASARGAEIGFFDWCLQRGAADAAELGYVPLPPPLVEEIHRSWSETLGLRPTMELNAAAIGRTRSDR